MKKISEQEQFSLRLKGAMRAHGYRINSPMLLVREFNARYGGKAVTSHAARKWLMGESIPTQEKIIALAKWLQVSPLWLRYDGNEEGPEQDQENPYSSLRPETVKLLADYALLDDHDQEIIEGIAALLAKAALALRQG
ncbi:MAG: hypothetical protein ACRYGK_09820 [Janthinobacterium lividum]